MLYSLVVMIGDGKGSFWCGTEGKYMSSDPTSRARAGPGEEEEEEKSSATRFELGGPKGALRFDETTPSPGGRATAAARGTAAGGSASAPGSTLGGSDGNDGASAAVAWPAATAARLALRRWREGPGWCCSGACADEAPEQADPGLRGSRFAARCFFGAFVAAAAATGWRQLPLVPGGELALDAGNTLILRSPDSKQKPRTSPTSASTRLNSERREMLTLSATALSAVSTNAMESVTPFSHAFCLTVASS